MSDPKAGFPVEESPTEWAWVQRIGPLLTAGMGGPIPERADALSEIHDILDIGCGSGDWALAVATKCPGIQVTGIDISEPLIGDALSYARAHGLKNAEFRAADATQPLDFAGASFDLVNARSITGWMNQALWPKLLGECSRILRPGGTLRITELSEPWTNSPASGKLWSLFSQSMAVTGRTFDPLGQHLGTVHQLPSLLRGAGLMNVQILGHGIEFSAGSPSWEGWAETFSIIFELIKPFFLSLDLVAEEEFDRLHLQMQEDMCREGFRGLLPLFTFWGTKPGEPRRGGAPIISTRQAVPV